MEQFRQIGEVLGSMKALMVLRDDISINKRQCCLILEIFTMAFTTIAAEIRQSLRLEEKNTKWRSLDHPLRELYRVFREAELYLRQCLDAKDWWGKAITLHRNKDCLEFHIHNLLCNFPAVIEGIEAASEISGVDPDEIQRRGVMLRRKYDNAWNDPMLFGFRFGEKYLLSKEMCRRFESVWREDQWLLSEVIKEKRKAESGSWTKNEHRLCDSMLKKLRRDPNEWALFPSSVLTGAKDFQVRRRLGSDPQLKEIQWLGNSFVMRHVIGEINPLRAEITGLLSLSHPNILQYLCGFYEEEKKECFLVMELMNKDLGSYIRESSTPRRRTLMSVPVIVDLMLQIARGMEYLHSEKIFHGELNPTNILIKPRSSLEGYFHVKVSGFGLSSVKMKNHQSPRSSPEPDPVFPFIWYAPEVLAELEQQGNVNSSEKADVYSFGMVCFEILTGKVPFEDEHLQGDKMGRNIRAGERPLFPFASPKFLVNLTKKCWQTDPMSRPSFASICRILRYIKKFLVMNPEASGGDSSPDLQMPPVVVDFCEIECRFQRKFSPQDSLLLVSQIPFQMFSFRLGDMEKNRHGDEEVSKSAIEGALTCKEEDFLLGAEDLIPPPASILKSVYSDVMEKKFQAMKKAVESDARSVYSDVPRNRILSPKKGVNDTRSVYSDSPQQKKLSSAKRGLRDASRTIFSSVPEKGTLTAKKGARDANPNSPDKKSLPVKKRVKDFSGKKAPDLKLGTDSMHTEIPEMKAWNLQKSASTRSIAKATPKGKDQRSPSTPRLRSLSITQTGKEQRSPSTPRLRSMNTIQTKSGLMPATAAVELSSRAEIC